MGHVANMHDEKAIILQITFGILQHVHERKQ